MLYEVITKRFVEFYIENAGKIAKDVGYVALPQDMYTKASVEFAEFVK